MHQLHNYNLPDVALRLSRIVTIAVGDDGAPSASFRVEKKLIVVM